MKRLIQALRTPDEDAFAELFARELAAEGRESRYVKQDFALHVTPGEEVINLVNMFRDYLTAPRLQRAALLSQQARSVLSAADTPIPQSWSQVRGSLLPLVRHRGELEYARLSATVQSNSFGGLLGKPLSDMLFAFVAYDTPLAVVRALPSLLAEWGVSADAVWQECVDNLRARSPDRWIEVVPGVFRSGWQDVYDISRLVLPDLFHRLPLAGRPVAFAPERNALVVTGDRDQQHLLAATAYVASILKEASRPITAQALLLDDATWRPFELPEAAARIMLPLAKRERTEVYQGHLSLMEKVLQARGADVFVASILVAKHKESGDERHIATWPRDCDTLLPEVEVVAMSDGTTHQLVSWSTLVKEGILPAAEEEWWPPRYRVKAFPNLERLSKLGHLTDLFG